MSSIRSNKIKAEFLPELGMLGTSLQYEGIEILRRIEDIDAAARRGSTAGIPILYPWANRLSRFEFETAGENIRLNRSSPFLHLDENGLPLHGVAWSMLKWNPTNVESERIEAELNWNTPELLQIFPFPHHVQMTVAAQSNALNIETTVIANSKVPVSFGYHPYFGIPNFERSKWKLNLPAMKKLLLDQQRIPTGKSEPFDGFNDELGINQFDDGFELLDQHTEFSIEGNGWKISVQFVSGYTHVQVFAPQGKDFIALEPMTAPTNALISGQHLRILQPGESFSASFAVVIERSAY
jgi:aldose 1-epimerase